MLVPKDMTVREAYDYVRTVKSSIAELVTEMQSKTGDASTNWEDAVITAKETNAVLKLLYGNYLIKLDKLESLLSQIVTLNLEIEADETTQTITE